MSNANSSSTEASEDITIKTVNKRYEDLVTVKKKAMKGKGAWYWAHLDPLLITNPETNLPKAVKLKCTFCNAVFSASNPSRTASEHLKRGSCHNFNLMMKPISQLPRLASPCSSKRSLQSPPPSMAVVGPSTHVDVVDSCKEMSLVPAKKPVLSGGREDLRPLALLEDSVKRLKGPEALPCPALRKEQVEKSLDFLADWCYESCGSLSFSSLEHPKFRAFLNHVGLGLGLSRRDFYGARLDCKFEEARVECEARISDAAFFQVACDGWKSGGSCGDGDKCFVEFLVNLPNGNRVFHKALSWHGGRVPCQYVEEVMWEAVRGVCGNGVHRCVGIVCDKYKSKALRNLEHQNHWMVNISCMLQAMFSLIKDFYRELPLFRNVSENCLKIANLINSTPQFRNIFCKFRLQGLELAGFIRVPHPKCDVSKNFGPFIAMLEDILKCSRVLHVVVLDESYKVICMEDVSAKDVADIVQDVGFWNDVEGAHSLIKLIMRMIKDIEAERPLIGQCLPLWEELRAKVKNWCTRYSFPEGPVQEIIERRFKKNYHPAMAAAFILDPLYLMRDAGGKYLPPCKCLTQEQEKDIDKLVTRLVPREEAHIALMELMKWRSEGLDPLYAQAVQVKQQDPVTGKMKIANPQSSRLVWETCLKEYKSLSKVAVRLLFLHATSCGIKFERAFTRWFSGQAQSRLGLEQVQKLVFVAARAKIERRDFSSAEEKDAELFGTMNGEDEMLNEVFVDTSSM